MRRTLHFAFTMVTFAALAACSGASDSDGASTQPPTVDAGLPDMEEMVGMVAPDAGIGQPPGTGGGRSPSPPATVTGRVVNIDGEPLHDIRVLCCSHSLCYSGATDMDGRYEITDIDPDDVYKMQTADPMRVYSSLYYYQEIISGETSELGVDVVLPRRQSMPAPWPVETGGSIVLANGELTLTADAGSLEYPIGLDEEIMADRIPGDILPPYQSTPWTTTDDALIVFTMNPSPVIASTPVTLQVTSDGLSDVANRWQIFSLNPDNAAIESVGTATVNADGFLVSDDDALLTHLITVILAPITE